MSQMVVPRSAMLKPFHHRLRMGALCTTLTVLPLIATADVYSKPKKLDLSGIESHVGDTLISEHVPGAALVIVKDGKLIDIKCYGYRDFAKLLPVTPITPFCIGSCTQGFTEMAAQMAADAGSISLEDNPNKYLPELKFKAPELPQKVTLREFLKHRGENDDKSVEIDWNDTTPRKMLHVISGVRPSGKPARPISTASIAGWAVAAATGASYEKLISDSIFRPLAMNDSRIETSMRLNDDARGHILDRRSQPMLFEQNLDVVQEPDSGILSSPRDMAKWLRLLTGDGVFEGKRLVSQRGYDEIADATTDPKTGMRVVRHIGVAPGYSATVAFLPDRHIGVVILTNLSSKVAQKESELPMWVLSQVAALNE